MFQEDPRITEKIICSNEIQDSNRKLRRNNSDRKSIYFVYRRKKE